MVNCSACIKVIRTAQQIKCTKCSSVYHLACINSANSTKLTIDSIKTDWVCPECQCKEPKTGNVNTALQISAKQYSHNCDAPPIASDSASPPAISGMDAADICALTQEIKLLRGEMGGIKGKMQELTELLEASTVRLDEYATKMQSLEVEVLDLRNTNTELSGTIMQLKDELNTQKQDHLRNEMEMIGIHENPNENPVHLLLICANKLGVPMQEEDIDSVARAGPRRRELPANANGISQSRPLVARFVRRQKRDEFLKAVKVRKSLSSNDLEVAGPSCNVYFNERLTQYNRQLFRQARRICREAHIKYCWVKNGTVFARKQEGSPAIALRNNQDLEQHLGVPPKPFY